VQQHEQQIDWDAIHKANGGAAQLAEKLSPTPRKGYASKREMTKDGFLNGPVPLPWMMRAARLRGSAFLVGMIIWYLAGYHRKHTVQLSTMRTHDFGVDVDAKGRALRQLEQAELIEVTRRNRSAPIVRILQVEPDAEEF
jgi:hypothetical protein